MGKDQVSRYVKCGECEHLGDGIFPVSDLERNEIGFSDRPAGQIVEYPCRRCEADEKKRIIVYENLEVYCDKFEPRKWVRPETCGECERMKTFYSNGKFICFGYPFYVLLSSDDKACANGKIYTKGQISLF